MLLLKIIQNADQIVFGTGTSQCQYLLGVLQIKYVRKLFYSPDMIFVKSNGFNGDGLAGFDHAFKFFFSTDGNAAAMVDNGDPGTDLFHFFHVVGSVDNCRTLSI